MPQFDPRMIMPCAACKVCKNLIIDKMKDLYCFADESCNCRFAAIGSFPAVRRKGVATKSVERIDPSWMKRAVEIFFNGQDFASANGWRSVIVNDVPDYCRTLVSIVAPGTK